MIKIDVLWEYDELLKPTFLRLQILFYIFFTSMVIIRAIFNTG